MIVNNPLELTCIASGIPAPKISWMKDGRPLPQTDQVQTLGGGEVLRISSSQVSSAHTIILSLGQLLPCWYLRNVGKILSLNWNISQLSVTLATIDWSYNMHDWVDTYKVTWLERSVKDFPAFQKYIFHGSKIIDFQKEARYLHVNFYKFSVL